MVSYFMGLPYIPNPMFIYMIFLYFVILTFLKSSFDIMTNKYNNRHTVSVWSSIVMENYIKLFLMITLSSPFVYLYFNDYKMFCDLVEFANM